jgi:hypothetical protein
LESIHVLRGLGFGSVSDILTLSLSPPASLPWVHRCTTTKRNHSFCNANPFIISLYPAIPPSITPSLHKGASLHNNCNSGSSKQASDSASLHLPSFHPTWLIPNSLYFPGQRYHLTCVSPPSLYLSLTFLVSLCSYYMVGEMLILRHVPAKAGGNE